MNKLKYMIPLFALILLIPVDTSNTFAQSVPGEGDFTENIGPIGTVNESADIKLQEINEKYQDLKNKHYTINEEFNTANSTAKITELKSDYIQTLKEFNTLSYVEPERNYLAEWSALDAKIIILEELQYGNYAEPRQVIIDTLYVQMNEIEQESISSMVLDSILETKLRALQDELYNKYTNINHFTYVGDSSVEVVYVDAEQQKVILLIDENKTLSEKNSSSITISQEIMDNKGIDKVTINFLDMKSLTCTSRTANCDPLIGGISLARGDSSNSLAGTVGFRVKDSSNNKGFVTAGHVVQFENSINTQMRQPVGGSVVGTILSNGDKVCYTDGGVDIGETTSNGHDCDFAFVKMNRGISINDDIYKSSRSTYDINAMAISSDQVRGTMVKHVGTSTGLVTGSITDASASDGRIIMSVSRALSQGDSGGPVFKTTTGARNTQSAEVFGIVINKLGSNHALYEPTHKIMNELNLRSYH